MAELQSVQGVPSGLLELLGMKGSGQNPKTFDESLRGVIDVREMYALTRLSTAFDGFNNGATGTSATVTVPSDEFWILLQAQALLRTADATTTFLSGQLELDLGGGVQLDAASRHLNLGDNSALPEDFVMPIPYFCPYPIVVRPGGRISARVGGLIGGSDADVAVQCVFGLLT